MFRYFYVGDYTFVMRDVMINMGSAAAIFVTAVLLYKRYVMVDKTLKNVFKYMFLPIAAQAVLAITVGKLFGTFIRGMTFGLQGSITEKIQYIYKNAGTHFIGIVIVFALILPFFFRILYGEAKTDDFLNISAFFFSIQHMFNRIGCFCEGCCYGIPMSGFFSVKFPDEVLSYRVFPSQIFELVCMVVLIAMQIVLYKKGKDIFELSLSVFGLSIYVSEFFINKEGVVTYFNMTAVQYSALLLIIIALVLFRIKKKLVHS